MKTATLGKTATSTRTDPDGTTHVRYHQTDVVSFNLTSGEVTLRTGGWRTVTTKRRMNQAARQFNLPFSIGQTKFEWSVYLSDGPHPFDEREFSFFLFPHPVCGALTSGCEAEIDAVVLREERRASAKAQA